MEKSYVELTCWREGRKLGGCLILADMLIDCVTKRVKHPPAMLDIGADGLKLPFIDVASKTAVDKVFVAIIPSCGHWTEMVHRQFATGLRFGDTAIAATIGVAPADRLQFAVSHDRLH